MTKYSQSTLQTLRRQFHRVLVIMQWAVGTTLTLATVLLPLPACFIGYMLGDDLRAECHMYLRLVEVVINSILPKETKANALKIIIKLN